MSYPYTESTRGLTAKSIMNSSVRSLRDDMSLQEASNFLTENEISGAPVVDESNLFVGVLSVTDIAQDCAERGQFVEMHPGTDHYRLGWEDRLDATETEHLLVGTEDKLVRDVMTPTIYTISEDTPVHEIAQTMVAGRVHRLFVTRHGDLVGIITTLDLLQLLTIDS